VHRMHTIKYYCGCLPSLLMHQPNVHCDVHHVLSGGRRIGDHATVGMSPWHHRGMPWDGKTEGQMEDFLGPSMAKSPGKFKEKFGTQQELLEIQDYVLELWERKRWFEFQLPTYIAHDVRLFWKRKVFPKYAD